MKLITNRGFVLTSTLLAWALGLTALLGGGAYVVSTADFGNSSASDSVLMLTDSVSEEEAQGLIFMREEEKLARDVYRTLFDAWDVRIFQNISYSEEQHMSAVKSLLDKYNIDDPVTDDIVGVFVNTDLQNLYNSLIDKGTVSLVDALEVGATIEDVDIRDLQNELAKTDNKDIEAVYENLMRGSRNHMRAFVGQLESRGGEYKAQFLDQSEIDEILADNQERGNHRGGAKRNGM